MNSVVVCLFVCFVVVVVVLFFVVVLCVCGGGGERGEFNNKVYIYRSLLSRSIN